MKRCVFNRQKRGAEDTKGNPGNGPFFKKKNNKKKRFDTASFGSQARNRISPPSIGSVQGPGVRVFPLDAVPLAG
ncbi:uncharacterized protein G2W53_011785 [Senna tora]|uniref:Uncharacterized protein n=1 Tax=Senna tora TaxID=362788 RepID=A0A834TY80_9FABA|nr:uncharacterized protein G2W53_011785 [Senna tora]